MLGVRKKVPIDSRRREESAFEVGIFVHEGHKANVMLRFLSNNIFYVSSFVFNNWVSGQIV